MNKYRGERIPSSEQEQIVVNKIHFLIHPGFLSSSEKALKKFPNLAFDFQGLVEQYIERAKTLPPDEIVFAFSPGSRKKLKRDSLPPEPFYLKGLCRLKEVLGPRLIIVGDMIEKEIEEAKKADPNFDFRQHTILYKERTAKISNALINLAKARGYIINPNVSSEAWGETLVECLQYGAANLNSSLGLEHKTALKTKYSDMRFGLRSATQILNEEVNSDRLHTYKPAPDNLYFDHSA